MEGVWRARDSDLPAIKLLIAQNTVGGHLLPRSNSELSRAVRQGHLYVAKNNQGVLVASVSLAVYNARLAEGLSVAFRGRRDAEIFAPRLFEWCRCELSRLGVQKFMVVTADVPLMKRFGFHLATRSSRVAMFRPPAQVSFREAREAGLDDVDGIHRLVNQLAGKGKLLSRTRAEVLECLAQFFVVRRQGRVVACGALEKYSSRLAEIRSLAVADSHRGNGYGTDLVNACLARAKALRVREVMAVTWETEFFGNLGFTTATVDQKFAVFQELRGEGGGGMTFCDITVTICLDVEPVTLETLKGYQQLHFFNVVAKKQDLAREFRNAAGVAELASRRGARYVLCEAGFRSPYAVSLRSLADQYGFKVEFIQTGCRESELFEVMKRILEAASKSVENT